MSRRDSLPHLLLGLTVVLASAAPAGALLNWEDGSAFTTFGANEAVTIALGIITPAPQSSCPNGIGDFIWPAADVYVVASGAVGGTLSDASGSFNTVLAAGGGAFVSLTVGYTGPVGSLGPGTYAVVYDECQDGHFDAAIDQVFDPAFEVVLPTYPPMVAPHIAEIKSAAAAKEAEYTEVLKRYSTGLILLQVISFASPSPPLARVFDALVALGMEFVGNSLDVVDPIGAVIKQLANLVLYYRGIRLDPPDPAFMQLTPWIRDPLIVSDRSHPTFDAAVDLGNAAANEAGLALAVLRSLERYQGAAGALDGRWALRHARALAEHVAALRSELLRSNAALDGLDAELALDPGGLDPLAGLVETLTDQISSTGFDAAQRALLESAGFDEIAIDQLGAHLAGLDPDGFTEAELRTRLQQAEATNATLGPVLDDLETDVAAIVAALLADPSVVDVDPTADAGGPYTGTEGVALVLDATGSAAAPGRTLVSFDWDLDGDGDFDDAVGAQPGVVFDGAQETLVGVRVVDDVGAADLGYARLSIAEADVKPVIDAATPVQMDQIVRLGDSLALHVTASDPDGGPVAVVWQLDASAVGSGPDLLYAPTLPGEIGLHRLRAIIDDGDALGGAVVADWAVVTLAPDGDGDGWAADVDCDDGDPAVYPGAVDLLNGVDDDCDPGTPDGGVAPTVSVPVGQSATEGTSFALAATFTHPDLPGGSFTATVDWGDGADEAAAAAAGVVTASHVWADDGVNLVTVCVAAAGGASACAAAPVTVANADPVAADGGELIVNGGFEGGTGWSFANLDGAGGYKSSGGNPGWLFTLNQAGQLATDPELWQDVSGLTAGAVYTLRGDYRAYAPFYGNPTKPDAFAAFADDQLVLALPRPVPNNVDTSWAPFMTTFSAPGETVRIRFAAERGGDDSSFDVDNISLSGEPSAAGTEGAAAALVVPFEDLGVEDTHEARIDWGDGSPPSAGAVAFASGNGQVTGTHVYMEDGVYAGEVCIEDDDGGSVCKAFTATIDNAAPEVTAGPDVDAGPGLALAAASFTDPGFFDTHVATVDWGDGGGPEGAAVADGSGAGLVSASHLYAANGVFMVEVCVTDDEGDTGCDQLVASVTAVNQAPAATAQPDQSGVEGGAFLHAVAFEDPNPGDSHSVSVDWGDGSPPEPLAHLNDGGARGFGVAAHVYRDDGVFQLRFEICDQLLSCDESTAAATIANLPPVLMAEAMAVGDGEVEVAGSFTDPGELDTHLAEVDWGDGMTGPAAVTQGVGGGALAASHRYAVGGAYDVAVCVRDDDEGSDCVMLRVEVEDPDAEGPDPVPAIPTLDGLGLMLLALLLAGASLLGVRSLRRH